MLAYFTTYSFKKKLHWKAFHEFICKLKYYCLNSLFNQKYHKFTENGMQIKKQQLYKYSEGYVYTANKNAIKLFKYKIIRGKNRNPLGTWVHKNTNS